MVSHSSNWSCNALSKYFIVINVAWCLIKNWLLDAEKSLSKFYGYWFIVLIVQKREINFSLQAAACRGTQIQRSLSSLNDWCLNCFSNNVYSAVNRFDFQTWNIGVFGSNRSFIIIFGPHQVLRAITQKWLNIRINASFIDKRFYSRVKTYNKKCQNWHEAVCKNHCNKSKIIFANIYVAFKISSCWTVYQIISLLGIHRTDRFRLRSGPNNFKSDPAVRGSLFLPNHLLYNTITNFFHFHHCFKNTEKTF